MYDLRFGRPPWCCPTLVKFWGLVCASWRAACLEITIKMVRLPGIAPGLPAWHADILLLNHNRQSKRAGAFSRRRPVPYYNKEQTPLGDLFDPNPRFHGGCFGV